MSRLIYALPSKMTAIFCNDNRYFENLPLMSFILRHGRQEERLQCVLVDEHSAIFESAVFGADRQKVPGQYPSMLPYVLADEIPNLRTLVSPRIREVMSVEEFEMLYTGLEMHVVGWLASNAQ